MTKFSKLRTILTKNVGFPLLFLNISSALTLIPLSETAQADTPFKFFTDFGYYYNSSTSSNFFQIHNLDLFVAGPVDNHVSYLAEINFQPSFSGVGVDLERTFVQYSVAPWLKIALGRFHTALGYWNETYHHGGYLQTAASRPVMEQFEDSGGLLPIHSTGLEFRGNMLLGSGNLGYIVDVGNGRGPVKDPPSFYFSYTPAKSVSAVVYYETDQGLRFGANFWRSDLPGGSFLNDDSSPSALCTPGALGTSPEDPKSIKNCGPKGTEYIFGGHLIYNSPTIEWFTEYQHMIHNYTNGWTNADGSSQSAINLLYSQFGYHIGLFTPYARYEINQTSTSDAYLNANPGYMAQGLPATTSYYIVGSRYELSSSSALKLEITRIVSGANIYMANLPAASQTINLTKTTDWLTQLNWSLVL